MHCQWSWSASLWCAVSGPLAEGTYEHQFVEFLVKVLEDPAITKRFFAEQCTSAPVSGGLASLYTGVQRLKPGAASVNACRDNGNAAEDLLACASLCMCHCHALAPIRFTCPYDR